MGRGTARIGFLAGAPAPKASSADHRDYVEKRLRIDCRTDPLVAVAGEAAGLALRVQEADAMRRGIEKCLMDQRRALLELELFETEVWNAGMDEVVKADYGDLAPVAVALHELVECWNGFSLAVMKVRERLSVLQGADDTQSMPDVTNVSDKPYLRVFGTALSLLWTTTQRPALSDTLLLSIARAAEVDQRASPTKAAWAQYLRFARGLAADHEACFSSKSDPPPTVTPMEVRILRLVMLRTAKQRGFVFSDRGGFVSGLLEEHP